MSPLQSSARQSGFRDARRHGFIHLDNLLPERACSASRLTASTAISLFTFFSRTGNGESVPAGPFRTIAGRDRAVAHFQRSLCGRAIAALGQRDWIIRAIVCKSRC